MSYPHGWHSDLYNIGGVFVLSTFGINTRTEQPKYEVIDRIGNSVEIADMRRAGCQPR
jgi:hypothetical protein